MKDLSIAIVAYNDEDDVKNAVESIEKCTPSFLSKDIYIVDNSTEKNLLSDLENKYEDVHVYVPGENLGFGKGHNYVLDFLDSKYHGIVNPDVLLTEDVFSPLLKFMEENGCGMSVPRLTDEAGNLQKVYRRDLTIFDMFIRMFLKKGFDKRRAYHTMQDMDYSKPFRVPFAQGSFLVIKTELFKRIGGFDDRFFLYMEDADLCKRVNEIDRLMYCPYATAIHKWEKGSHKNKKLFLLHVQSMMRYFMKWGIK